MHKAYDVFGDDKVVELLVTHRFLLEDIQKAFEIASNYEDGVIKAMIIN